MDIHIYKPTEKEQEQMIKACDKIIDILAEFKEPFQEHILKTIIEGIMITKKGAGI